MKSARRSPNRGGSLGSVAAPILLAALISALSLLPIAAALAQVSGEAELLEGDGGGPGAPGQDGADSAGGGSGESGTDSQGADGVSRKGLSVRGTGVEEVTAEEEPAPPRPGQQAPARPRAASRSAPPVQQPTADLVPGQPPVPIGSGPPEAMPAPQPELRAEATAEEPLLAWLLLLAGGLLAIALIVGLRRGTGRPGRRSLRDATA